MLGSKALTEVEGFVCQTYRKCAPPALSCLDALRRAPSAPARRCCRDEMLDLQLAEGSTPPPGENADESGSGAPGSGVLVEVDYNRTCVPQPAANA